MKDMILLPMALYFVFFVFLMFYAFTKRKRAVINREIHKDFYKTYDGHEIPENLKILGRHINNQFEVPAFFLISCVTVIATGMKQEYVTITAFAFVFSRFIHSYIHLNSNHVLNRAKIYGIGLLLLLLMWGQILIENLK